LPYKAVEMSEKQERKLAVLLNGNAKRVNKKVRDTFEGILEPDDLYYSKSLSDSRQIARTIVERRYQTILTGGGDGTFSTFVTHIFNQIEQLQIKDYNPRFGVLKLGTGNALAATFGASTFNRENLMREIYYAANGAVTQDFRLLEVEGRRTPFAGLGFDAMILNDYNTVKELLNGTPLQNTSRGLLGYWIGLLSMSIPRYITEKAPEAIIVNEGETAWRVNGEGKRIGPVFKKGDVIFKGKVRMVSGSKVPFYGFEFKLFPFAMTRGDKFHLRVHNVSILQILYLPSIWKGFYNADDIFDFLVDSVSIYLSAPVPFQIGGDGEGWRSYVKMSLSEEKITMIDFKACNS